MSLYNKVEICGVNTGKITTVKKQRTGRIMG